MATDTCYFSFPSSLRLKDPRSSTKIIKQSFGCSVQRVPCAPSTAYESVLGGTDSRKSTPINVSTNPRVHCAGAPPEWNSWCIPCPHLWPLLWLILHGAESAQHSSAWSLNTCCMWTSLLRHVRPDQYLVVQTRGSSVVHCFRSLHLQ